MDTEVIGTEEEYEAVVARIGELFYAEPGTPEAEELEALVALVQAYERETCEMSLPDPVEAIEYYMETRGLSVEDLAEHVGSQALVSAVLNRERPVTSEMADRLEKGLGIPSELLVQPYRSFADVAQEEGERCEAHLSSGGLHNYRRFEADADEQEVPSYGQEERKHMEQSPFAPWTSRTSLAFSCV